MIIVFCKPTAERSISPESPRFESPMSNLVFNWEKVDGQPPKLPQIAETANDLSSAQLLAVAASSESYNMLFKATDLPPAIARSFSKGCCSLFIIIFFRSFEIM